MPFLCQTGPSGNLDFCSRIRSYDRSLHTLSIGYCAPVPQTVLTPIINILFEGMTLSVDMKDDAPCRNLRNRTYQLAVTHKIPDGDDLLAKKCGSEKLYLSILPSDPLAFLSRSPSPRFRRPSHPALFANRFWMEITRHKTPNTRYLLQVQRDSFLELAQNSDYPFFVSSYFMRRGEAIPGRINLPLVDEECQTDYYLVCLKNEARRYEPLFRQIDERTIH